mgnify:CR=1 FL=1
MLPETCFLFGGIVVHDKYRELLEHHFHFSQPGDFPV